MKDLLEVCCGLDVHKEMIAACLLSGSLGTEPKEEVREFSTLLSGLEEMREWMKANKLQGHCNGKHRCLLVPDLQCPGSRCGGGV